MAQSRQLSNQTIISTLAKFHVSANAGICDQIREYTDLLLLWNQKVSLTTIIDPLEILTRHFGESMFAVHAIPTLDGRLADVGSGPGFPGLALKILRPSLEVFLIESVMKKATFLAEATRHLGLSNVKVVVGRFEDLADDLAPLDFICARALGDRDTMLAWATHNLNLQGKVVLWLGADALDLACAATNKAAGTLLSATKRQENTGPARSVSTFLSPTTGHDDADPDRSVGPSLSQEDHTTPPDRKALQDSASRLKDAMPSARGDSDPARRDQNASPQPRTESFQGSAFSDLGHRNQGANPQPSNQRWSWLPPVPIPGSTARYLVVGSPLRETEQSNP